MLLQAIVALVFACGPTGTADDGPKPGLQKAFVFVNEIDWRERVGALNQTVLEGDAEFIVLYPDGRFAFLSGTVFRVRSKVDFGLCAGCGFSVRWGSWMREEGANAVLVRSAWTYLGWKPAVGKYPEVPDEEWAVSEWSNRGAPTVLRRKDVRYVLLAHFEDMELLERCLREQTIPVPTPQREHNPPTP